MFWSVGQGKSRNKGGKNQKGMCVAEKKRGEKKEKKKKEIWMKKK